MRLHVTITEQTPGSGKPFIRHYFAVGLFSAVVRPDGFNPRSDEAVSSYQSPLEADSELKEGGLGAVISDDLLLNFHADGATYDEHRKNEKAPTEPANAAALRDKLALRDELRSNGIVAAQKTVDERMVDQILADAPENLDALDAAAYENCSSPSDNTPELGPEPLPSLNRESL